MRKQRFGRLNVAQGEILEAIIKEKFSSVREFSRAMYDFSRATYSFHQQWLEGGTLYPGPARIMYHLLEEDEGVSFLAEIASLGGSDPLPNIHAGITMTLAREPAAGSGSGICRVTV